MKSKLNITLDVDYGMNIYDLIGELEELATKHNNLTIYQPTELSFDNSKEIKDDETTRTNT